ncbi:zinc finger ccch domain-containing protein 19 [Quercus suber]|uniref:Zinc finger ccch domain-containing protein 19 n=1 Tax=Quercus suber TaxID=58331 RepID=A0AAW0J019_QUESU
MEEQQQQQLSQNQNQQALVLYKPRIQDGGGQSQPCFDNSSEQSRDEDLMSVDQWAALKHTILHALSGTRRSLNRGLNGIAVGIYAVVVRRLHIICAILGCIKDADYLCVRGSNGFCGTCMRTVKLIENLQGNKDTAQVDFDDKSSWEYLFKMYWIFLKGKLSLTLDELTRAKNPWKEADTIVCKTESSGEVYDGNTDKGSSFNHSCTGIETNNSRKRKTRKQPLLNKDSLSMEKSVSNNGMHLPEGSIWASKELLEFVAHMKNGDTSPIPQFDVQALLLEYITKNNLRDPQRKCQIVCDSRLINLFGKARVAHFEMLKLLESHFLIKENSPADDILRAGVVDAVARQLETDGNYDSQLPTGSDKRRRTRKRPDERGSHINLDAFAAIDVHNINLIYLRRNLMESLMDDADKFHDKVIGSFVRIRIPNNDQKQEMYRLVQVVGTSKVTEPYKIGERTTDVMLEILNLDKKEVISIEGISNQEFSEDECKRLRQSIKCGLIKQLNVGEIQTKAMTLKAVSVNDVLEAEILRLNHLRDRAKCVEKLQLLKSPEERQRRLNEIPEVHTDPKMDPSYDSEDNAGELDEKRQDVSLRPKLPGYGRKGREPISARRAGDISDDVGSRKSFTKSCEQSSKVGMTSNSDEGGASQLHDTVNKSSWNQEREAPGINSWNPPANQVNTSGSLDIAWNSQAVVVASEISPLALSSVSEQSANDSETDKIWHYEDPAGKIQGPFSMLQLRKWSEHFPSDQRIWRINEKQDKSVLLTDALSGQHHEVPPFPDNGNLLSQGVGVASDVGDNIRDGGWSESMNAAQTDNKEVEGSSKPKQEDSSVYSNNNDEVFRGNEWGSNSSSWTTPADVANSDERRNGVSLSGWDSSQGNNSWLDQPQLCNSSLTPPAFSGKSDETLSHQVRKDHGGESNSGQENGNCNSNSTADGQTKNEQGYENRSDSEGHSGQSSGHSQRPPPINGSLNSWDSNSGFTSVVKSLETTVKNQEIVIPDLPSPTLKQNNEDSKCQAGENKQAVSSSVPVQNADPSWSTASSLVDGGTQIHDVAAKWGGYSPTPAKPSVEEWDSSLVSASSLKPTEMISDHAATPTSINDQLTHSSPSHPPSNTSNWQAIVTEPADFCSLADESVSDLLAEVEAMESLDGLPSPTSIMKCGGALIDDSKNCMSPLDGFSPALDPGKGDALSSTGDLQVPSQSTVTDEPRGVSGADVLDPQKRSSGHSSTSFEVEGDAKRSDISVNQWESGSDIQPTPPSTASWDMGTTDWRVGSESTATSYGAVQGGANLGWGGLDQRTTNMGYGTGQVAAENSVSMNMSASAGNAGIWGTQPRYGGDRFSGPRDRGFQSRDLGYGRGRGMWNNRQSMYGGGNGGGSFRPPPKGQRVCKFYESGYCKKGAACGYWHP